MELLTKMTVVERLIGMVVERKKGVVNYGEVDWSGYGGEVE